MSEAHREKMSEREAPFGLIMANIGSLMNLITNAEIRYEGFMCHLDARDTTIGLQYVRSFGTEGRRKDGSQVPPTDTIYEYLYFHRRDIKDVVVRSSISLQTTRLPDDPAIIQCYIPPLSYEPANLSTSGAAQGTMTGYNPQSVVLVPASGRNYSFRSIVENPGSWGSSFLHLPLNISRPAMPTVFPWFPGSSGEVSQFHRQHLPPPPRDLMASPPFQQHTSISNVNANLVTISPSTVEPHNRLMQPIITLSQNGLPPVPPIVFGSRSALTSVPPSSATGSQIFFPPLYSSSATHSTLEPFPKPSISTPPSLQPSITLDSHTVDFTSQVSHPEGTSNIYTDTKKVTETKTLVPEIALQYSKSVLPVNDTLGIANGSLDKIPVQSSVTLLQQGGKELPSTQSFLIENDDPKLNDKSTSEALLSESGNAEEPPQQSAQAQAKAPSDAPVQANNCDRIHTKEREHGVERFSKDFDFEAMNKKFNKEEVWRSLDKTNMAAEVTTGRVQKLVKKDDFFDTLDYQSDNGGEDLSEQKRIDNETFGNQERQGKQEQMRPGGSRHRGKSYRGRGYVNTGRGRGRRLN